ncbi:PAC2 family-domain-containing protein [Scheffersomyces amazonensis]|uniref:PAC2 family-domain-containing protein n=1 Tax=Scheffersomyces amazonensis TaxID=1078765 RepID=UPI00315CFB7A
MVVTGRFNRIYGVNIPEFSGSKLIIPSISIGNIPQFSVDLLIHSLDFIKIGSLDDIYLYPFASPIDHAINKSEIGVSNTVEIYYSEKLHITIIQQRSPIIPSFIDSYINEIILPFIVDSKFSKVIILDSSDAGLIENVVEKSIVIYTSDDLLSQSLESLNLNLASKQISLQNIQYEHSKYVRSLLGALNSTSSSPKVDTSVLVSYVYEGDNFQDGEELANKVIDVLDLPPIVEWTRPISWLGAYGDKPVPNATEDGLFG